MKLILALALGATAQFATPALRGGARRLEALELLGAEESAKVEAEQEAQRAKALEEAMAQLKQAQDMMAKAEALKAAAATAEAAPEAPKEPAAAEAPAEERVAVAAPAAPARGENQGGGLEDFFFDGGAEPSSGPSDPSGGHWTDVSYTVVAFVCFEDGKTRESQEFPLWGDGEQLEVGHAEAQVLQDGADVAVAL